MLKTKEFMFPTLYAEDPYAKDAKCLSDIIDKFQEENKDKIEITDIKYCFTILSKIKMSMVDLAGDKAQAKEMDIPISTALVIYKERGT